MGHEQPTLLLTNPLRRSAAKLIGRYARRMLIENNIEDGASFFYIDALSSAVALKVNCERATDAAGKQSLPPSCSTDWSRL